MSLIEDAAEAKRLGISYGEYMKDRVPPPRKSLVEFIGPRCQVCRAPVPKGRRKFCSDQCYQKYSHNKRKATVFI